MATYLLEEAYDHCITVSKKVPTVRGYRRIMQTPVPRLSAIMLRGEGRINRDDGITDQITVNERIKALLDGEAGHSHEGGPLQ